MKLVELLEHFSERANAARDRVSSMGLDAPISVSGGELLATAGTLHLYRLDTSRDESAPEDFLPTRLPIADMPITVIPAGDVEPTEGFVVASHSRGLLVQTFDAFGPTLGPCTIIPDSAGFYEVASKRFTAMAAHPEKYTLGPAERLGPWVDPAQSAQQQASRGSAVSTVLSGSWGEDLSARRLKLVSQAIELVRSNKRVLLISHDHRAADEVTGAIARSMRGAGLQFKSLLSRYEMPLSGQEAGMPLGELGFEAQMHQFYAKSRNEKATLRRKYERFRELTPLLAYKSEKQRDLNEVRLLEWRLVTQLTGLQAKIKEIDETVAQYEQLPLWKRLSMQAGGKNVASLGEYRKLYEQQAAVARQELDVAKARIDELRPEAAIPKDIKPEYNELKEEIVRLGGTKKIRELLAAGEGTNRQAFVQNKRVIVTTAARVVTDPLFERVRFDVLLVDEGPSIPSPFLLAAAALVRERIIFSGDQRALPDAVRWESLGWGSREGQAASPTSVS